LLVGIEEEINHQLAVSDWQLSASPNPFTHNTVIQFVVRSSQPEADEPLAHEFVDEKPLTLKIYDLGGRLVRSFDLTNHQSPFNQIIWDGKNDNGKRVPAGVYLYQVEIGEFKATRKLTVLR
jgi:hypothetical protein